MRERLAEMPAERWAGGMGVEIPETNAIASEKIVVLVLAMIYPFMVQRLIVARGLDLALQCVAREEVDPIVEIAGLAVALPCGEILVETEEIVEIEHVVTLAIVSAAVVGDHPCVAAGLFRHHHLVVAVAAAIPAPAPALALAPPPPDLIALPRDHPHVLVLLPAHLLPPDRRGLPPVVLVARGGAKHPTDSAPPFRATNLTTPHYMSSTRAGIILNSTPMPTTLSYCVRRTS